MNNQKSVMLSLGIFLLMASIVSAVGVGSIYSDQNQLKMYAGESQTINLGLSNHGDPKEYTFVANMTNNGEGIARLGHEDPTYHLAPYTDNVDVPVAITVPANAQIGKTYLIDVKFSPLKDSTGAGMVDVVGGFNFKVGVLVVSKENSASYQAPATPVVTQETGSNNTLMYVILAVIVVAVVAYLLTKKKK